MAYATAGVPSGHSNRVRRAAGENPSQAQSLRRWNAEKEFESGSTGNRRGDPSLARPFGVWNAEKKGRGWGGDRECVQTLLPYNYRHVLSAA